MQDCPLGIGWMRERAQQFLSATREERENVVGMDKSRADIIAGGTLLLCKIMEKLHLPQVFFSDRDNLEGYLALRELR